jgi:hypothetical protein
LPAADSTLAQHLVATTLRPGDGDERSTRTVVTCLSVCLSVCLSRAKCSSERVVYTIFTSTICHAAPDWPRPPARACVRACIVRKPPATARQVAFLAAFYLHVHVVYIMIRRQGRWSHFGRSQFLSQSSADEEGRRSSALLQRRRRQHRQTPAVPAVPTAAWCSRHECRA